MGRGPRPSRTSSNMSNMSWTSFATGTGLDKMLLLVGHRCAGGLTIMVVIYGMKRTYINGDKNATPW